LIARPGVYRRLMAPQLASGGERAPAVARVAPTTAPLGPEIRPLAADAAAIGWVTTLRTLLRFIRPWSGKLAFIIGCGIGRVAAFIGVSVLGALTIAALAAGRPTFGLIVALLIAAPVAATLHWLESWLAHDVAYRLLAEMRIALFDKLEALAPSYLVRRRSGDLIALASQDIETVEYFFAHTVAPALVALLVPSTVLIVLAVMSWPIALT